MNRPAEMPMSGPEFEREKERTRKAIRASAAAQGMVPGETFDELVTHSADLVKDAAGVAAEIRALRDQVERFRRIVAAAHWEREAAMQRGDVAGLEIVGRVLAGTDKGFPGERESDAK